MPFSTAALYLDGPFAAYLKATNEKQLFADHFARLYPRFRASRIYDRQVKVLDLGCGHGSTSQSIMSVLTGRGQKFQYFGVDPHQAQLNQFASTVPAVGGSQLSLLQSTLEGFDTSESFDLVIAYQMLYHIPDMAAALRKILRLGREVLIGHHGQRGIGQVQEQFKEHVTGGPHIISTDTDVQAVLDSLGTEISERYLERHGFVASIDVNSYGNRDLVAFFLQCDPAKLEDALMRDVHLYLEEVTTPSFRLPHDVGLFTITNLVHPSL